MSLAFDLFAPGYARARVGDTQLVWKHEGDHVELVSVRTPAKARRHGAARAALQQLLAATDAAGLPVQLCASPLDAKTQLGRLVRFYLSLGFQPTGRRCNPAGDPILRRPAGG